MSYRALVSIVEVNSDRRVDFVVRLYDGFGEGEAAAHMLARTRQFDNAVTTGFKTPELFSPRGFTDDQTRAEWIETYCDQQWVVSFETQPCNDLVRIQIVATDAEDNPIFFRSQVYAH